MPQLQHAVCSTDRGHVQAYHRLAHAVVTYSSLQCALKGSNHTSTTAILATSTQLSPWLQLQMYVKFEDCQMPLISDTHPT